MQPGLLVSLSWVFFCFLTSFSGWPSLHNGEQASSPPPPKHTSLKSPIQKEERWPPFLGSTNQIPQKDSSLKHLPLNWTSPCGKRGRTPWFWPGWGLMHCIWWCMPESPWLSGEPYPKRKGFRANWNSRCWLQKARLKIMKYLKSSLESQWFYSSHIIQ